MPDPPEVFSWDTPDLEAHDRYLLAEAEQRAPDDAETRLSRYWAPGRAGYAVVADLGDRDWLCELWVHPDHRGRGVGRLLLAAVLSGRAGREIVLEATPFTRKDLGPAADGLDADQLAAWYGRHGFAPGDGWPVEDGLVRRA